jgi:hypothetical protein
MSRKTDKALDTAARGLNKVAGPVGDAIANTVLAPLRSNTPCTCGDKNHKH